MDLTRVQRLPAGGSKIAGVGGALADHWRIDPLIVRAVLVVLALSGGVGLVLYAALWLTMPPAGGGPAILDGAVPGWRSWPRAAKILALLCAVVVTSGLVGQVLPFGLVPALVILAVWYFGLHRPRVAEQRDREAVTARPSAPFADETDFTRRAAAWQQRVHAHLAAQDPAYADPAPRPPLAEPETPGAPGVDLRSGRATAPRPAYTEQPGYSMEAFLAVPDPVGLYGPETPGATVAERPKRRTNAALAWGGLATAGAAMGAVALVDAHRDVPFAAYPASALAVVGLALLIGTRVGRPRGFIALGVLLSMMSLTVFDAPSPSLDGQPATAITVAHEADLPRRVRRDTGSIDLDLSQVTLTRDQRITVAVDAGDVRVRVPQGARVRVDYTIDAGSVEILDREHFGGLDGHATVTDQGAGTGPELVIEAQVGLGQLEVVR